MKIRKDDSVIVIAGKDKGKKGKVLKAMPSKLAVIVEGVNVVTRHVKKQGSTPGQKLTFEKPIDVSNVALECPHTKEATGVGFQIEKGKKVRISKKLTNLFNI
ncbi:MAG: 50S ribosomal protein L24 [Sphaerospermopsis sp. SIO1G2]|nr:50S ribosomal protein L24 [Sphaerospermopsis sp. SIO1G2]